MKLFVGLGNPGPEYRNHRHNVGFMAVDRIAADHRFPPFRAKFRGEVSEGRLGEQRVMLLKPLTYMNESGLSVGEAMRFLKIEPAAVTVFHDELDLPPAALRAKQGGGHAGHNGLRSLHAPIGDGYARVRIGIGHPGHKDRVAAYVLSDFAKTERPAFDDLLTGLSEGAVALAEGRTPDFLAAVQRRTSPPPAASDAPRAARQGEARKKTAQDRTAEAIAKEPDGPLARLLKHFSGKS